MRQRFVLTAMVFGALVLGACGRKEPPATPTPTTTSDTAAARRAREEAARLEQMRRDSIAAADRARAEAEAAVRRVREAIEAMVFFDYDSSELGSDARQALDAKVEALRANPDVALRIEGHADERGSTEYNIALGMRRAESVRSYLTGFGLEGSRFQLTSLGEERPLDPSSNESAWARNRRAEFHITGGGDRLTAPGR